MPLCLHGTLAASQIVLAKQEDDCAEFVTMEGKKLFVRKHKHNCLQVKVLPHEELELKLSDDALLAMLFVSEDLMPKGLPFQVASVGSPKLLIPMESVTTLDGLNPDFEVVKNWSISKDINGFYVYTQVG